jgi:hypothetical protein
VFRVWIGGEQGPCLRKLLAGKFVASERHQAD